MSLKIKILIAMVAAVVISNAGNLIATLPGAEKEVLRITENYMEDITILSGSSIENEIEKSNGEIPDAETLKYLVGDVALHGIPSSYAYVVAADKTMIYHPTKEKIGLPVENDAVKQVISQMESGIRPETTVIKYDFKGVRKYAAFYVGKDMNFIVVVTADESEMLGGIDSMKTRCATYSAVIILVLAVISYLFMVFILRYINHALREMDYMSQLDFTLEETYRKIPKDEIGSIIESVHKTKKSLKNMVIILQTKIEVLNEAVEAIESGSTHTSELIEQVDRAVNDIAKGATNQAEETSDATENVIAIGDMIASVSDKVSELGKTSEEMVKSENTAKDTLDALSQVNAQTKKAISKIYAQIQNTNVSAEQIKSAAGVITDIASETNLLALNASIEAARAGDAGKGFSVVAEQIKILSEQSNTAAQQIAKIISDLLENSGTSVKVMEEVNEIIIEQNKEIEATQKDFKNVGNGIYKSIEDLKSIMSDVEHMNESKDHIVDSVQSLTAIAEENAAGAQETSASTTEVTTVMEEIRKKTENLYSLSEEIMDEIEKFSV